MKKSEMKISKAAQPFKKRTTRAIRLSIQGKRIF